MAQVTLSAVSKIYDGGVRAVNSVDLEVPDTSFTVLVGPSGCGKSTLLRMIAGIEEISSGELRIDGRLVNDVPPRDRDIAMVFQNYALYPHMSVYENMAFSLRLRKAPKAEIEARVREAADMLGLDALLERKPKALSGGQRQRVAVGRAIVRKPKVFLFDEPLSNLDAKMRVQTRAELVRLHRRLGATMIYVTHDQAEAMTMGDRIVVMRDGRVQQIAAPMEIYSNPTNAFVAGFIGSPPMNFIRCDVRSVDGALTVSSHEAGFSFLADALPDEARRGVPADTASRDVLLGVRPENIRTEPAHDGTGSAELTASVELIEPMGAEQFVTLRAGATTLVARLDPDEAVALDEPRRFYIHLSKARLFDPDSEAALAARA